MTDKLEALKAKKPTDTKTLAAEKAGYVTDDNSGGYYVVECQECGEIYPSQECDGGGQIADSGDYNDALCPHCGCESPDECSDTPLVWNVQQAKINALLAALEEKGQRIANQAELVEQLGKSVDETNQTAQGWMERALAAEQRLQQPIKLPKDGFCPAEYDGSQLWVEVETRNKALTECAELLKKQGFKVEGE